MVDYTPTLQQNPMGGQNLENVANILKQPQQSSFVQQMGQNPFGNSFNHGFQQAQQFGRQMGMTQGQPGQQGMSGIPSTGSMVTPNSLFPYGFNMNGVPTGVDTSLSPSL